MRRLTLAVLLCALALPAGAAHAAWFPAEVIDGPNADVVEVGDVDFAREGTGAVVYVRKDAGVDHVFLSRFVNGAFEPAVRVDQGQAGASSQPVVGVADNARITVAWVNAGSLFTAVKTKDAPGLTPPGLVAQGSVTNPSVDMSINGSSYVSFTQGGDVKVARAERDSPAYTTLPAPVDVDAAQNAGTGERGRSRIATSADGTALVAWAENHSDGTTHVYARRLFELRLSVAPQDLAPNADSPELDMEDDSSYAQVTFRQTVGGTSRAVMRRLRGSAFEEAMLVDGGFPAAGARVDLNGRGEGLVAASGAAGEALMSTLFDNRVIQQLRLEGGNGVPSQATPALGENEDGAVGFVQGTGPGDATVHGRYTDGVEQAVIEPDAIISNPAFGPVDVEGGFDGAASRAGDVAYVFVQGPAGAKRLVAGLYDRPPSTPIVAESKLPKSAARLRWQPSLNLWGPITYRILFDDRQVAEVTEPQAALPSGTVREGRHTWQVVAVDRRGQTTASRERSIIVDNTLPTLRVRVRKSGRSVTVRARAADRRGKVRSGMSRVVVDFGDGRVRQVGARGATKRYAKAGTYTVRVRAIDRAGNERAFTRRVGVG